MNGILIRAVQIATCQKWYPTRIEAEAVICLTELNLISIADAILEAHIYGHDRLNLLQLCTLIIVTTIGNAVIHCQTQIKQWIEHNFSLVHVHSYAHHDFSSNSAYAKHARYSQQEIEASRERASNLHNPEKITTTGNSNQVLKSFLYIGRVGKHFMWG